jgi:hypothetical protein
MNDSSQRNAVLSIAGEAVLGLSWALITPAVVLTVLLQRQGAGERLIGSIYGIETAGTLLPQFLGIYLFRSLRKRKVQSHYNMLFETCLHSGRAAHITLGNLLVGCVALVASQLSGAVASAWGLRLLFGACLGMSLVAVFWIAVRVREPRRLKACSTEGN